MPSQPWVLLQTVEVEQSELVLSKEKQGFPQTSSLPQIQRPAEVRPNGILWKALLVDSNLLSQVRPQEPLLPSSEMIADFRKSFKGERGTC